ncbi:MAG: substrate-binding domain-containing protein [Planctomycetes bacterium]|nr:substrate-binding domain-containing protein [Planctomycetota bacterium]
MPTEAQRAYIEILKLIDESYAPGERLPSERAFADMLGRSYMPVRQALERLRKERRVRTEAGRGSFVAGKRPGRIRGIADKVGVLVPGMRTEIMRRGFAAQVFRAVARTLARSKLKLTFVETPPLGPRFTRQSLRPPVEKLPWNDLAALIVYDVFDSEVLRHPRLSEGPVLVIDQDATIYGHHSVAFDDRQSGQLAARHLLELGHRRFMLIEEAAYHGRAYDRAWLDRRLAFEEVVLRAGGEIHPDWRLRQSRYDDPAAPKAEWRDKIRRLSEYATAHRPTACFAPSFATLDAVRAACDTFGLRVPREVSFVCVDAEREEAGAPEPPAAQDAGQKAMPVKKNETKRARRERLKAEKAARLAEKRKLVTHERSTYVSCDPRALGRRAAVRLLEILKIPVAFGSPATISFVPVTLHEGNSSARAPR